MTKHKDNSREAIKARFDEYARTEEEKREAETSEVLRHYLRGMDCLYRAMIGMKP